MDICLYGITAFEALRAVRTWRAFHEGLPRTSRLGSCGVPRFDEAVRILEVEGVLIRTDGRPIHVLVQGPRHSHTTKGLVRHVAGSIPARSLMRVSAHVLVPSPELCFMQLAASPELLRGARLARAVSPCVPDHAFLSEVDLAVIGFEMCGSYSIEPFSSRGFEDAHAPLTDAATIKRFAAAAARMPGAPLARRAADMVLDGARSPAETSLALLMCAPHRVGGAGFKGGVCNGRIGTPAGERFVDLAFPEHRTGFEYQGEEYHALDRVREDDRRQNLLAGSGMTILNVWKRDLSDPVLFDRLVRDAARAMGVRFRPRGREFYQHRALLRARVLAPARDSGAAG